MDHLLLYISLALGLLFGGTLTAMTWDHDPHRVVRDRVFLVTSGIGLLIVGALWLAL